jgi:hypothetical protein
VLAALVVWTGIWLQVKSGVETGLARQAAALRTKGWGVSWTGPRISGWPFRMDVTVDQVRLGEPSGWAMTAPTLKAEGLPYEPGHWIVAAPDGLTLFRPVKGPLAVAGRAIRASVSHLGGGRPRLSFEALDLTLTPQAGGQPAVLSAAKRLELHLQPGPDDQAALLVRIEDGRLNPQSALGHLAPRLQLTWDARLSHVSALKGVDWPAAVIAWSVAGGAMTVADADLALGDLSLRGSGGTLTVGQDGRLRGSTPLTLADKRGGLHLGGLNLGALTFSGPLALRFDGGRASIGPFPVGPALKVY